MKHLEIAVWPLSFSADLFIPESVIFMQKYYTLLSNSMIYLQLPEWKGAVGKIIQPPQNQQELS